MAPAYVPASPRAGRPPRTAPPIDHCDFQSTVHLESLILGDVPLAVGRTRQVFAHPQRADCLVKVMRPEFVASQYDAALPLHRRWKLLRRAGRYTIYLREFGEYVAARSRFPQQACPLAPVFGIVDCGKHGLGLVVARITDGQGALAPTLRSLVERDGLDDALRARLAVFAAQLHACDVIVHDLNARNILQGVDGGRPRLVLVDGFGDRNIVPVCSMSRTYNRVNTRKRISRMMASLREIADARGEDPLAIA